jgi:hypothetical protein
LIAAWRTDRLGALPLKVALAALPHCRCLDALEQSGCER